LVALERLAETPVGGHDIVRSDGVPVAGHDDEGEALADEDNIALPVLAPVPLHANPARSRALDVHLRHVAVACHVGDEHEVEVVEAVDREADAAAPDARGSAARPPDQYVLISIDSIRFNSIRSIDSIQLDRSIHPSINPPIHPSIN
jgi:hypothetical protein